MEAMTRRALSAKLTFNARHPETHDKVSDISKDVSRDKVTWKQIILEMSKKQGYTGIPL